MVIGNQQSNRHHLSRGHFNFQVSTWMLACCDPQASSAFLNSRRDRPWRFCRRGETDAIVLDSNSYVAVALLSVDQGVARFSVAQRVAHSLQHDLDNLLNDETVGRKSGLDSKPRIRRGGDRTAETLIEIRERAHVGAHLVVLARYSPL